jgi:hypothetical protein
LLFAKDVDQQGQAVGTGTRFSTRDPQIVQFMIWTPDSFAAGTRLGYKWIDRSGRVAVDGQGTVEQGKNAWVTTISPPKGGFPATRIEVQVTVNGAIVAREQITIE